MEAFYWEFMNGECGEWDQRHGHWTELILQFADAEPRVEVEGPTWLEHNNIVSFKF